MTKKTKKLALARETVRSLSWVDVGKVAGGTTGTSTDCWSNPEYSCQDEFRPLTGWTCAC
jgi:hypothetical protein